MDSLGSKGEADIAVLAGKSTLFLFANLISEIQTDKISVILFLIKSVKNAA